MSDYCKILIIDDEFIMRQGMKHLLDWEKEGFQIVGEASNGQEGLELIEQLSPHIILADIVMPVLNGMEFSKLVQKKYPQIQIIILSSYDNFEYVKSTLLNGAVDYILKPTLNPQDLLKVLKKAASRIPGMVLSRGNEINYEKRMERYMLGFDTSLDTRLFETYFKDSCFRLFGTNIRQIFGGDKSYFSKVETQLKDFFLEHETNYQVLSLILNKEYLVYIINYKVSKEKQLTEELHKLVSDIAKSHNKTHFALTESSSSLTQIKEMYEEEFILLAESYFYQKDNPLVGKKDLIMGGYSLKKFDFLL
jgi:two-component system response regulator YesN